MTLEQTPSTPNVVITIQGAGARRTPIFLSAIRFDSIQSVGSSVEDALAVAARRHDELVEQMDREADSDIGREDAANMREGKAAYLSSELTFIRIDVPEDMGAHRLCDHLGLYLPDEDKERLATLLPTKDAPRLAIAPQARADAKPERVPTAEEKRLSSRRAVAMGLLLAADDDQLDDVARIFAPHTGPTSPASHASAA